MAYEYDVFLSYPREGQVCPWVHNHLFPLLRDCLGSRLEQAPRIFVDTAQPTGVLWPDNLRNALTASRLLVAVWTPPYFRSKWCLAEWNSMLERESLLQGSGHNLRRGLVYPVVYSDGDHFHQRARDTQYRRDLSKFTYPYPCFRESTTYLSFHDTMMSVAEEIESHLSEIPDWQPDWPIVEPELTPSPPMGLPRI